MKTPPKFHFRKHHLIISLVLFAISAAAYWGFNPEGRAQLQAILNPGSYVVTKAVDGDTLDVKIDGHPDVVRLIGVDTPETHDPRKPVQCYGQVAADYTKSLTEGKVVRLVADPDDSNRDKYNRLLRYVYLPDGRLLNADLIQTGHGFAYTIFPFTKLNQFRGLASTAEASNQGLWAACKVDASQDIKQTNGNK